MKFFTRQWWEADSPNAEDVFTRYARHLESIEDALPRPLVELQANHTLHDARVRNVECDFASGALALTLDGWDAGLQRRVRYTLHFSEVVAFEQSLPPAGAGRPELDDLAYWECSLSGSDIELGMLFVSGAEFRIVFAGFGFTHEAGESGVRS